VFEMFRPTSFHVLFNFTTVRSYYT